MRVLVAAVALIVCQLGPCAVLAEAQCDQYCTIIKRALDDRSNQFSALKGTFLGGGSGKPDDLDRWKTDVSPPNMLCGVIHYDPKKERTRGDQAWHPKGEDFWQFSCNPDLGGDSKKMFGGVFAAVRQSEPKWKWFKVKESPEVLAGLTTTTYCYGGPTKNELYIVVTVVTYEKRDSAGVEIHSTPVTIPVGSTVKPYSP